METTTKTEPMFIGSSSNPALAGTRDIRAIMQARLLEIKKLENNNKKSKDDIIGIISSNLIKNVKDSVRRNFLCLTAYHQNTGSTHNTLIDELIGGSFSLDTEGDQLGSYICLIKKSDLKLLGISQPVGFTKLINELDDDFAGNAKVNWGFCSGDENGKNESEPHIFIGFKINGFL